MDHRVINLYNDCIHGDMPTRNFLKQLAGLAGSVTAANAALALVEPNYAWGQQVAPVDDRLQQGSSQLILAKNSQFFQPLPEALNAVGWSDRRL